MASKSIVNSSVHLSPRLAESVSDASLRFEGELKFALQFSRLYLVASRTNNRDMISDIEMTVLLTRANENQNAFNAEDSRWLWHEHEELRELKALLGFSEERIMQEDMDILNVLLPKIRQSDDVVEE
jgi:predicted nucleotidyltransferase